MWSKHERSIPWKLCTKGIAALKNELPAFRFEDNSHSAWMTEHGWGGWRMKKAQHPEKMILIMIGAHA